jgi:hypothetical protein
MRSWPKTRRHASPAPKALEKLWKDWKLTDKMPDIDFTKELVVVSTTTGSRLRLALTLDDKGDLQVRRRA